MERQMRNKDIITKKSKEILVIGAGSIGSTVVQDLAMMGVYEKIIIVDNDILSLHNLPTTRYFEYFVGDSKVNAAKTMCTQLNSELQIETWFSKIEGSLNIDFPQDIIMCTDSMHSRRYIYERWLKNPERRALIDIRMAALAMERIITTKENDKYMSHWLSDEEIPDEPCTAKHTVFTTSIASGLTVNGLFSVLENRADFFYIYLGLSPFIVKKEDFVGGNCAKTS
jgi:molybdopterin/thiamine biosynthesis adenylyltransferase